MPLNLENLEVVDMDNSCKVWKYVNAELGVSGWVSSLSFWCLNPAVVFEDVASKARSIILTSGYI
jgi:Fanconi anemia group J protein